ncbi:hypothetical protein NDU88_010233 [Pleurodeles waltl]|uniref:Uncharacterized protein n=1 Tax=Pleurodeles waltl TaxID=8319 RepID=A0AAV7QTU8_PLEWA|nr:hypothetical protein NDU88_010233 [Pleurodeles waltl]
MNTREIRSSTFDSAEFSHIPQACYQCLPVRGSRQLQRPPTPLQPKSSPLHGLPVTVTLFSGGVRKKDSTPRTQFIELIVYRDAFRHCRLLQPVKRHVGSI